MIIALISDLQTGATDSTIQEANTYLTAALNIQTIDNVLPAALYAIEQVGVLGEYAIENGLYAQGNTPGSGQYAAQYTDEAAYRDSVSTTAINDVVYAWRDLIEVVKNIFAPGGTEARSAAKQIWYNENYYVNELQSLVNGQFGSGAWTDAQENFAEGIVDDIVHDIITTDTYDKTTAYTITLSASTGTFAVGDLNIIADGTITSDTNGDIAIDPAGTGAIVLTGPITHAGTQTTTGQLNVDNLRLD